MQNGDINPTSVWLQWSSQKRNNYFSRIVRAILVVAFFIIHLLTRHKKVEVEVKVEKNQIL